MEDIYKNESPARKWARMVGWADVCKQSFWPKLSQGKHLVLIGKASGDIASLLASGVPRKNIVAVDKNPERALLAQDRFPGMKVICGDLLDVLREQKNEFSTICLDFHTPMIKERLDLLVRVMQHSKDGTLLTVGFQLGGETPEQKKYLLGLVDAIPVFGFKTLEELTPVELAVWAAKVPPEVLERSVKEKADLRELVQTALETEPWGPLYCTQLLSAHLLLGVPRHARCACSSFSEVMVGGDSPELPLLRLSGCIKRPLPGTSLEKFQQTLCKEVTALSGHYRDKVMHVNAAILRERLLAFIADVSPEAAEQAPLLFNLPKSTIVAWKAHQSRGMYKKEQEK